MRSASHRTPGRPVRVVAASFTAILLALGGATATQAADITAPGGAQRNTGDRAADVRASIVNRPAKNVILLIGDGMGDSEITSARNYQYGAAGKLPGIDAPPLTGQYTTYALDKDSKLPNYTTDSAASGTAWATGTKSYNGAISVDVDGKAQQTMLQTARANGLKTGNVTTAELQDATPAVQAANVTSRKCYGPVETTKDCAGNALENGGAGSITEQLINTRADVTFGGGAASFAQTATAGKWQGQTLLAQAKERKYNVVNDAAGMAALTAADQNVPVLGLFAAGNMETRWDGPKAVPNGGSMPAVSCQENAKRPSTMPTLAQMTGKSIDLLKGSSKGFFLQVEGASIDKQDHAANPCAQIGETVDLDEAVQKAMDFARADGNTMVVVTADHGHSSQIIYTNGDTPGLTRTLTTKEGAPMTMAYGTAVEGKSQMHTGTQLRVAGYGPGAANVVGLTDQTDMFFTVTDALKLDRTLKPGPDPAPGTGTDPGTEPTTAPVQPGVSGGSGTNSAVSAGNGQNTGGQSPLAVTGSQIALALLIAAAFLVTGGIVLRANRKQRAGTSSVFNPLP